MSNNIVISADAGSRLFTSTALRARGRWENCVRTLEIYGEKLRLNDVSMTEIDQLRNSSVLGSWDWNKDKRNRKYLRGTIDTESVLLKTLGIFLFPARTRRRGTEKTCKVHKFQEQLSRFDQVAQMLSGCPSAKLISQYDAIFQSSRSQKEDKTVTETLMEQHRHGD